MKIIEVLTSSDVFAQAFIEHPVGILFGIGFITLCFYFGMALVFNGWPEKNK